MTAPDPFEKAMSDLVKSIGEVERLSNLKPDQIDRLIQVEARLRLAVSAHQNAMEEAA